MAKQFTLDDLILIFGKDFIPNDIDTKILMKHFQIGVNRIIGEKSVDKIKTVLLNSIEVTRAEQNKVRGGVIESPLDRYKPKATIPEQSSTDVDGLVKSDESKDIKKDDKYGLASIKSGLVSKRLQQRNDLGSKTDQKPTQQEEILTPEQKTMLPSVEDLTVLSGGTLSRNGEESAQQVQREVAIREYQVQDESRSIRWGTEVIKDREGKNQEINNPAYIFHSDLWQFEESRESNLKMRCDILQHVSLDMLANNINVVMLDEENEPFFIVEGHGILHSKDTLKDKIKIDESIHLVIISSEAWQIALKKPESFIRGRDFSDRDKLHSIDMTSVIPLANIRSKIVELDSKFKVDYQDPHQVVTQMAREIEKHRKNIVWTCGAPAIPFIRDAVIRHRFMIEKPTNSLNLVVIGTNQAIHPMKIVFDSSGNFQIEELFPGYCSKHFIFSNNSLNNIFGSIPAIYDFDANSAESEIVKIAKAVYYRLGYSALETTFDPGYITGNPSEIIPISKLDIILPPTAQELNQKLENKGLFID